jgi:hypothetical protein
VTNNIIRVGSVEIMSLSDGMLEFDLCNFFPTIPEDNWQGHESDLTEEHKVRFNLGSFLIRSQGRTILVDTGLGPKPADAPDVPWGQLMRDFQANGVRPDEVDMVVLTHLHRDHVGWNLMPQGERYVPTFPNARYWMSTKDWDACHQAEVQPQRFPNAPTCVWPLADLGLIELMDGEHTRCRPQPGAAPRDGLGLAGRHGPRTDAPHPADPHGAPGARRDHCGGRTLQGARLRQGRASSGSSLLAGPLAAAVTDEASLRALQLRRWAP